MQTDGRLMVSESIVRNRLSAQFLKSKHRDIEIGIPRVHRTNEPVHSEGFPGVLKDEFEQGKEHLSVVLVALGDRERRYLHLPQTPATKGRDIKYVIER